MASLLSRTAVVAALCLPALLAGSPAAQADTYRFWSYWHAEASSWSFAKTGPSSYQPPDGAVEGWRYTETSGNTQSTPRPRRKPSFERICADVPPQQDAKRVAVVIDYGTGKEAPEGAQPPSPRTACAQLPADATGAEVLAAVAETRFNDDGLVCTVDGYPQGACPAGSSGEGEQATATPDGNSTGAGGGEEAPRGEQAAASDDGGLPLAAVVGVALGGLLIGILGALAILRARRSGS